MPVLVAPSLLSCDFGRLGEEAADAGSAGADLLHIDVMDGSFVPNITIGPLAVAAVRRATSVPLDVHLMIVEPQRHIEAFARAGASWITVHAEATHLLHRTVRAIRELGVRPGVALNPASPLELVTEVLPEVDMVLVMSVEPGFGGQKLIPSAVDKVARLHAIVVERGLELRVEVDGGVDEENARELGRAGADVLVAGTSVFSKRSYAEAIAAIRRAAEGA